MAGAYRSRVILMGLMPWVTVLTYLEYLRASSLRLGGEETPGGYLCHSWEKSWTQVWLEGQMKHREVAARKGGAQRDSWKQRAARWQQSGVSSALERHVQTLPRRWRVDEVAWRGNGSFGEVLLKQVEQLVVLRVHAAFPALC